AGLLLLFLQPLFLNPRSLLLAAQRIYPNEMRKAMMLIVIVHLAVIAIASLCLLTAWALKRERGWARWTGIASSLGLLPLFPWMTVPGFFTLVFLAVDPPESRAVVRDKSRLRPEETGGQWIIGTLTGALFMAGYVLLSRYARDLNLPQSQSS